jgi:hypothetical protein
MGLAQQSRQPFGDRGEQDVLQALSAARGHHEQIGLFHPRADVLERIAHLHVGPDMDVVPASDLGGVAAQDDVRPRDLLFEDVRRRPRPSQESRVGWIDNLQQGEPGVMLGGNQSRSAHGVAGGLGRVDGHQDGLEPRHETFLLQSGHASHAVRTCVPSAAPVAASREARGSCGLRLRYDV